MLKVQRRGQNHQGEDATAFWKGNKRDAEWIDKSNEKMPSEKQNTMKTTQDDAKRKLKSIPGWKGAGPDKIQRF